MPEPLPEEEAREMAQAQLTLPMIHCDNCAQSIKRTLSSVEGVGPVGVDVPAKQVRVEYDSRVLDEARLRDTLEGAGFAVEP